MHADGRPESQTEMVEPSSLVVHYLHNQKLVYVTDEIGGYRRDHCNAGWQWKGTWQCP